MYTEKFRAALKEAGFKHTGSIFSDNRKGFRRLKLWYADEVDNAPLKQQRKLEAALRQRFGSDIHCMYFVNAPRYYFRDGSASLCIRLKNS